MGPVWCGGEPILLLGRPSDRVPFGTGRAMADIGGRLAAGETFTLYHPHTFAALQRWLAVLENFSVNVDMAALRDGMMEWPVIVRSLGGEDAVLAQAVRWKRECASPAARRRRVHGWMSGIRTLKVLHALRDAGLPNPPWRDVLARAPFVRWEGNSEDDALEALWRLDRERLQGRAVGAMA